MSERDKWLTARRGCIGASDAAVVLGLSPWKSAYALWAEKAHGVDVVEETERMKWGSALEPVIANAFEEWAQNNIAGFKRLNDPGRYEIQQHTQYPFITATLDREVIIYGEGGREIGVLEIKTSDGRNWREWEDAPPLCYQVQVQHQMYVTGCKRGWLAVLIGGNDFRIFPQERNEAFILSLEKQLLHFWRQVETVTPPDVDGSDSTARAIKALHPLDSGVEIELPADVWADDLTELEYLKSEANNTQAKIAVIENRLKSVIADASVARVGDWIISYKTQTRPAHTVSESTCRVLRRTQRKDGTQ
jgi:putative phage-type endonuclease